MADVNNLLANLKQVKKTGRDSWKACCPAHDDRSPSMAVKVARSGAILLHCFAGCSVPEIMDAIGMDMGDLFPEPMDATVNVVRGNKHAFNARDAVAYMAKESLFVAACCVTLREQGALPEKDKDRIMEISGRLVTIADEVL